MTKLAAISFGLGTLFALCLTYGELAVDLDATNAWSAFWPLYVLSTICALFWHREEEQVEEGK